MNKKTLWSRIAAICFYVASAAYYGLAIAEFVQRSGRGAMFLCLGSAMLSLGSASLARYKKEEDEKESSEEEKYEQQ